MAGVAIAPDGKIVVAGTTVAPGSSPCFRLNTDGTLDTSFGTDGLVTASVSPGSDTADAVAVEPDGSILVGAAIGTASGGSSAGLVHFGSDGSLDIGFGSAGVLSFPSRGQPARRDAPATGRQVAAARRRRAGGASGGGGAAPGFVLRLNPDFSVDTTFGSQGVASFSYGEFYDLPRPAARREDPHRRWRGAQWPAVSCTIGRLNADGSLDTTFGQGGSVSASFSNGISSFNSVFVQPDGKIVAVGYRAAGGLGSGTTCRGPLSSRWPASTRPSPAEASFSSA